MIPFCPDFPERLPDDVVEELVTLSDQDNNDWISYEEFVQMVLREKTDHHRAGVTKVRFDHSSVFLKTYYFLQGTKKTTAVWSLRSYHRCAQSRSQKFGPLQDCVWRFYPKRNSRVVPPSTSPIVQVMPTIKICHEQLFSEDL